MSGNVLLDSNIIVYLSKGELNRDTFFDDAKTYAISVISYMETLSKYKKVSCTSETPPQPSPKGREPDSPSFGGRAVKFLYRFENTWFELRRSIMCVEKTTPAPLLAP